MVRVSQQRDRRGEEFVSPADQVEQMGSSCAAKGWDLTVLEPYELTVSGDDALENRPSLSRAVVMVQTGAADVIVASDVARLWWNQEVRAQVLRLVEQEGGEVWTAANGCLTNATPAAEFTDTVRQCSSQRLACRRMLIGNSLRPPLGRRARRQRVEPRGRDRLRRGGTGSVDPHAGAKPRREPGATLVQQ